MVNGKEKGKNKNHKFSSYREKTKFIFNREDKIKDKKNDEVFFYKFNDETKKKKMKRNRS